MFELKSAYLKIAQSAHLAARISIEAGKGQIRDGIKYVVARINAIMSGVVGFASVVV
jgi:hypothetical protein